MILLLCKFFTIGAGGGGDVLSAYFVGLILKKEFNSDFVCGGAIWERYRFDKKPGPRSIDEILNARRINDCLAWMKNALLPNGFKPAVAEIAEIAGDAIGVDITKPNKIAKSIKDFCYSNGLQPVGVDAGGDILARGKEKVFSPLCDSIMLCALAEMKAPIAITGFGSDGELSRDEIEKYLSELAELDALIGVRLVEKNLAEDVLKKAEKVKSHASKIPLLAATGYYGEYESWDFKINVSILNALIFFLKSEVLFELNEMAKAVKGCKSIDEANEALHALGIKTELDLEREMLEKEK